MLSDALSAASFYEAVEGRSQCPLEHCMLSDKHRHGKRQILGDGASQCPLEHCMLSDRSACDAR